MVNFAVLLAGVLIGHVIGVIRARRAHSRFLDEMLGRTGRLKEATDRLAALRRAK